jgi:hypothetical protein
MSLLAIYVRLAIIAMDQLLLLASSQVLAVLDITALQERNLSHQQQT